MCARFLSHLLLLYIGRVHGPFSGCTVLGEVHPVSVQNKSLISDTGFLCGIYYSKPGFPEIKIKTLIFILFLFSFFFKYVYLPIGQVAPKFYLPHLTFYLPRASGQCLMLSPVVSDSRLIKLYKHVTLKEIFY